MPISDHDRAILDEYVRAGLISGYRPLSLLERLRLWLSRKETY